MTDPVHNVVESLQGMLVHVDQLVSLPSNPRQGNVDAIVASYAEFGQVKPIVAVDNKDGTGTVIAGNHQLAAAKQLGWTHIAVLNVPFDHDKAVAFALTDNRTSELGFSDQQLLLDMLTTVMDDMPDLFTSLGWDDFEVALMDEPVRVETGDADAGWSAPVLVSSPEGGSTIATTDTETLVTQGSTSAGAAGAKAVVQYTLVFDDAEQQRDWYAFLRYLKSVPPYSNLPSSAEQVIAFVRENVSSD